MTDQPATATASPAVRRFIIRILILDGVCLPIFLAALFGYRTHHVGWLLGVALTALAVMMLGVTWLVRDLKRSQAQ